MDLGVVSPPNPTLSWNGGQIYRWRRTTEGLWAPQAAEGVPIGDVFSARSRPENPLCLFPDFKALPAAVDFYFPCDAAEFYCPIFGRLFSFRERHTALRRLATLRVKVAVWAMPHAIRDELLYREAVVPFCSDVAEIRLF